MASSRKSLLMAYMHQKHRHRAEAAEALFVLFIFAALVLGLTSAPFAATGAVTSYSAAAQQSDYYNYDSQYYQSYPTTGLATGNSPAFVAIWLLSLVILAPIEFSLRKK